MSKMLRATTALSTLAVAAMIAGCANPMSRMGVSGGFAQKGDGTRIGLASRAQAALTAGDPATAIQYAERAVEASPNDAGFRALLGNVYLSAGRFASAEAAYTDSLSLLPTQANVGLKLALAQLAQGKTDRTLGLLDQLRGSIPAADVGLAMALAGQPGNAIALLDEAARSPGADARTRQNLALAHALAGDWVNARAVAEQDLPADQVDARLAEWMTMAQPSSSTVKVATLLGISPAATDPGQPVRLALADGSVRMAAAATRAPAPTPVEAIAAPQPQLALADTTTANPGFIAPVADRAPVEMAAVELPVSAPAAAPMPLADADETLEAIRREPVQASGKLPQVSELRRTAAARFAKSGVVVQLGAYGSPKRVQTAWSGIARKHAALASYTPATARFQAPSGTVYRLSVKGFATDREARLLCEQLQRSGSSCFVRNAAGDTAVRLASR